MAYPRVESVDGGWSRNGGAQFVRVVAGQDWILTVAPDGWVTVAQAALLLGVSVQLVGEWVRDGRVKPESSAGSADDGTTMLYLPWVHAVFNANKGGRRVGPEYR